MSSRSVRVASAVLLVLAARSARADERATDDCIRAHKEAQVLRREGKLRLSREKLGECSSAMCPSVVSDECSRMTTELDRVQPAVVFELRDARGQVLRGVRASIDGADAQVIDDAPVPLDPGEHVVTFDAPPAAPVTRRLVVTEGETSKRELVTFVSPAVPAASAAPPASLLIRAQSGDALALDGRSVGVGAWSGVVGPGLHDVRVSHAGKEEFHGVVDVKPGAARALDVTLSDARPTVPSWVWFAGAAVVAAAAGVTAYFLFREDDAQQAPPTAGLGSVHVQSAPAVLRRW